MAVQPTQTKHPWRATARTLFAAGVGLLTLIPEVATAAHVDATVGVTQVLAVTGAVTRILAIPGVEAWMQQYLPFLSAAPADQPPAGPGATTSGGMG